MAVPRPTDESEPRAEQAGARHATSDDDVAPARPERQRRRGFTIIAAAAAALPGVVALAFQLFPDLQPDPRSIRAATLTPTVVEHKVRFSTYLQEIGESLSEPDRATLDGLGSVVYVRVQIQGRKRENLKLRQTVYSVRSRRPIPEFIDIPVNEFRPDTPNDTWIAPLFVMEVGVPGRVFARFKLLDGSTLLAFADSPPLPGGVPSTSGRLP